MTIRCSRVRDWLSRAAETLPVCRGVAAAGAAAGSVASLGVAGTSGAGIATGLAAAGGIMGGGMALGPVALAGAPAWLGAAVLNHTVFRKRAGLSDEEVAARGLARFATGAGSTVGLAGVGAATVAGGASGPAIMSTLALVGGVVGGGALAGTAMLVVAPVVISGAAGTAAYSLVKWRRNPRRTDVSDRQDSKDASVVSA